MRKFVLILLGSIFCSALYAGTLENRKTGDQIEFSFNPKTDIITAETNSIRFPSLRYTEIEVRKLKKQSPKSVRHFVATEPFCGEYAVGGECILFGIPALAVDIFILEPTKAIVKLIKTMKYNKDFRQLEKSITENKTVKVSNKRFERISKLLMEIQSR